MSRHFSLKHTWERVRTVPGLGRNLLAMLVIAAVGLTSASIILGNQQFIPPWSDRYKIAAEFNQVVAVDPDVTPYVRIAGVKVGQVVDSQVTSDGHARLRLSLKEGITVYRNAHIVLRAINPLNQMYVEIDPGGPPAKKLPEGGVIPSGQTEQPRHADQVLKHLDKRSRQAVTNLLSTADVALASAPTTLPGGLNATDAAMSKLEPVVNQLHKRRQNIAELVTAVSKISTAVGENDERLAKLLDAADQALAALSKDGKLEAALKELPGTTKQLRSAMDSVNTLTDELNPALDNIRKASDDLPGALRSVSATIDELDETVRAARPAISKAAPLVKDLRPIVDQVNRSLQDLVPVSKDLQHVTKMVVSYLTHIQAFIYNTNGAFSLSDANGGFIRGHVAVPLPDAGVLPGSHGGDTGGRWHPDANKPNANKGGSN